MLSVPMIWEYFFMHDIKMYLEMMNKGFVRINNGVFSK